jgi:hypothetical protein
MIVEVMPVENSKKYPDEYTEQDRYRIVADKVFMLNVHHINKMNVETKVIKSRLGLLNLAEELGNVSLHGWTAFISQKEIKN